MDQTHLEEWSTTECIYNERINKIHNRTLLYLKGALLQEIEGNTDTEEKIFMLNFLAWLEYKLNNFSAAQTRTDEVLRLTNSTNLTALIGKVRILHMISGIDELEATKITLRELLSDGSAEDVKTDSRGQLAYCYCRLGGADFLKRSIGIFEELLKRQPSKDYWKLSLGIAHYNAWTTSPTKYHDTAKVHLTEASKLLTDVINTSNNTLFVRLAYRRMLYIKRYSDKYNDIMLAENNFFQLPLRKLVDELLEMGEDDAKTLSMLAETLRANGEVDRAIQLLEKSLKLKRMSKTYHFLAKCYEEKGNRPTCFEKAKESYEKSIQLSETNFAAIFYYALFLKRNNLVEECLIQFRRLTDHSQLVVKHDFLAKLRDAYQNVALCLMKFNRANVFPEQAAREQRETREAEFYLLQTVNLTCEMKTNPRNALKFITRQLENEKFEIPECLIELQHFPNSVPYTLTKLKEYLTSRQYELAYTTASIAEQQLYPSKFTDELKTLILEVKFKAAAKRIQQNGTTVHFITRPLFDSRCRQLIPLTAENSQRYEDKDIDVLILCDNENEDSCQKAKTLKAICTDTLGLETCVNTERCNIADHSANFTILEMKSAKLVLLLHNTGDRLGCFQVILERYREKRHKMNTRMLIGLLGEVWNKEVMSESPAKQLGHLLNTEVCASSDDAVMEFFCFMIGKTWPLL